MMQILLIPSQNKKLKFLKNSVYKKNDLPPTVNLIKTFQIKKIF